MALVSIVGVGAIGGTVAAHLCEVGMNDEVQFCSRQAFNTIHLEYPNGQISLSPRVVLKPDDAEESDWVFISTKAHQVEGAKDWLKQLCSSSTKVAVLQNGVEHIERVSPFIKGARVLPVVVNCPAVREVSTDTNQLHLCQKGPAQLIVDNNELGEEFQLLFKDTAVAIKLSNDFKTEAWKKLCLNVAGGAIAALTDQPLAVLHQPGMPALAKNLILECITVGRCEGADIEDSLADKIVNALLLNSKESLTSMLVDRRAGKVLEVDARNGAVVRFGEKYGIDTPLNKMATSILLAVNKD